MRYSLSSPRMIMPHECNHTRINFFVCNRVFGFLLYHTKGIGKDDKEIKETLQEREDGKDEKPHEIAIIYNNARLVK